MHDDEAREGPLPIVGDRAFRDVLEALNDQVAIGVAVRDASGAIIDFELAYMNAASVDGAGRTAEQLVGSRLLDAFPDFAGHGLLESFIAVVETGEPYVVRRLPYQGATRDGRPIDGFYSMRVVRFGDGYLAVSSDETEAVREEEERAALRLEAEANRLAVLLVMQAALPASLPEVDGVGLAARYRPTAPTQPVGGDWYDAFVLGDGRLCLVIADVTGHGPEAAAYMVQVRNIVRALALEHGEPAAVLGRANQVLLDLDDQGLFATCALHVYDPADRTLRWTCAGHFSPLLVASAPALLDAVAGPPLGASADAAFTAATVQLAPGDRLLLFTDGVLREREAGLADALAHLVGLASQWDGLSPAATVDAALADASGCDDVALVCLAVQE